MVKTSDDEIVDRALRASCSEMGSRVGMAAKPSKTEVRNPLSQGAPIHKVYPHSSYCF
jgi:hypothetical protein